MQDWFKDYKEALEQLAQRWPSTLVARDKIAEFSGGVLTPGTMKNLDSLGMGPPRIYVRRKVVYPIRGLIAWMLDRARLQWE